MAMTGRQGWADRLRSVSFSLRNELFTPSIHLYVFYFFTQPFDAMLQYAFKITTFTSLFLYWPQDSKSLIIVIMEIASSIACLKKYSSAEERVLGDLHRMGGGGT